MRKKSIICCLLSKTRYYLLWHKYKFDRWHASAPWPCRPYKEQVVKLASSISMETVVEIGCGLGDIISHITAKERYGLDIDERVIRAAKKLYPVGIDFDVASLFNSNKIKNKCSNIDLLIMVNWPHNVNINDICNAIDNLKSEIKLTYIIIDEIKQGIVGYKYNHTPGNLCLIGKIIDSVESFDGVRNLHLIKIQNDI